MKHENNPSESTLGRGTDYPSRYAQEALYGIPRSQSREAMSIANPLPFQGADLWTAWDLTWLDNSGQPVVAVADITVPANSDNLIESKSMKLYLGSFAQTRF